jgi:hypothetical protein
MRSIVVGMFLIMLAARPALPCQCKDASLAAGAARAKVAFVGKIVKADDRKVCVPEGCDVVTTYEVQVEGVWKGVVPTKVAMKNGDCAIGSLAVGDRWVFLGQSLPFELNICSGTQLATDSAIAFMTKTYGAPKHP